MLPAPIAGYYPMVVLIYEYPIRCSYHNCTGIARILVWVSPRRNPAMCLLVVDTPEAVGGGWGSGSAVIVPAVSSHTRVMDGASERNKNSKKDR